MKRLLPLLAGLLLGAGLMLLILFGFRDQLFAAENEPDVAPVTVGAPAPDFQLNSLVGDALALVGWRGKVVLLNFWATWCGPCRLEMPAFQRRADRHPDQLVIVAVNDQEDPANVADFAAELGLDFTILLDPHGVVSQLYRVRAYPTTYLIDRDGTIRIIHLGFLTESQLDDYLKQLEIEGLSD